MGNFSPKNDCLLVVGIYKEDSRCPRSLKDLDLDGEIDLVIRRPEFKASIGEIADAGDNILVVGLGSRSKSSLQALRKASASVLRRLNRRQEKKVLIEISRSVTARTGSREELGQSIAEGMALANWRYSRFDGKASKQESFSGKLELTATDKEVKKGLKRGLLIAEAVNAAREVASTPPNIANPEWLLKEAKRLGKVFGFSVNEINSTQAKKLGYGGLLAVGSGSRTAPRIIEMKHKYSKNKKPLVLVGKSITFDTGGYSLKVGGSMREMKYDKNGGVGVLGAMCIIAGLNLDIPVVGLLPSAENMVSKDAYRVDDILTLGNGVTVEVTNTDAEGRLVLADALVHACENYDPRAIVDMATLTGGIVVALGSYSAGLFCNDDSLRKSIDRASARTSEKVWRMPLWEAHRDLMRARHADLWNSAPVREAHPIQGAAFLSFFVEKDIPWAHIDIAGTDVLKKTDGVHIEGPNGYGARLLAQLAEDISNLS